MLSRGSVSFILLASIKMRSIRAATLFTLIHFPHPATLQCLCPQCPWKHAAHFHFRGRALLGFGEDPTLFLYWDKVISWSQCSSGDTVWAAATATTHTHRYFPSCLRDGTGNLLHCGYWCYSKKLFASSSYSAWGLLTRHNKPSAVSSVILFLFQSVKHLKLT